MEERDVITIEQANGGRLRGIARWLQRSASSISRELKWNGSRGGYRAAEAQRQALRRRRRRSRRARKMDYVPLRAYIDEKLGLYWSPEQIAGRGRQEPGDQRRQVSHETIYRFILESAKRGVSYEPYLRQWKPSFAYGTNAPKSVSAIERWKKP